MDKDWLYFSRFWTEYESGARRFIEIARANSNHPDMISCPCTKCRNLRHQNFSTVFEHLVIKGMDPTYTTWVLHEEELPSASCEQKGVDMTWTHRMYRDAHIDDPGDRDAVMDDPSDVLEDRNKRKEPDSMHELAEAEKILHRTSRKGFARLEHELKQKCTAEDPPVDRVLVWKKGYAPKDKPVSDQVVQYIEQMDQYSQSPEGQNPTGIADDALTHVFGRERPGRVRGMGFGVTLFMFHASIQSNRTNQGMRDEIQELKQQINGYGGLAERLRVMEAALANAGIQLGQTQSSTMPAGPTPSGQPQHTGTEVQGGGLLENASCTLMNWIGDQIDVARGHISSTDPTSSVHHVTLGYGYYRVWVDEILVKDVPLPRPTHEFSIVDEAYGTTVA